MLVRSPARRARSAISRTFRTRGPLQKVSTDHLRQNVEPSHYGDSARSAHLHGSTGPWQPRNDGYAALSFRWESQGSRLVRSRRATHDARGDVAQGASQSMADVAVEEGTGDGVTLPDTSRRRDEMAVAGSRRRRPEARRARRAVLERPHHRDHWPGIHATRGRRASAPVRPTPATDSRDRQPATDRQPSRRRAPIGRVGTPPGPRQALQGQEAGAVSGRAWSTSTGLATDTV